MPAPSTPDLHLLRDTVEGRILVPGDAEFGDEIAGFNAATVHQPDVVIAATNTADVAAAVDWAAANEISVAVQATGHGADMAVDGGLLITTARLRHVSVDPVARTARVGAGARWSDVVTAATPHGLFPLSGSTPDVGAVGYVLGGGLPILGRAFGFGADLVRSFEVVTADGVVRQIDAGSEPELFWALRGGRGAFAVVTEMTVELLPLTHLYGGAILYPGEAGRDVLHTWRRWVADLPDEMCTSVAIMRFPDAPFVPEPVRGQCLVALRVAYVGDAAEGERLLAPMRAAGPVLEDAVAEIACTASASIHRDPVDPTPMVHRGTVLQDLPADALDTLLDVAGPDVDVPLVMVEVRHLGGRFAREPRVPNAIPCRDAGFLVMALGAPVPPIADAVRPAAESVVAALAPWTHGGTPLTFLGAADPEKVAASWSPEVYARLRAVKATYDPREVFRQGHRIPVAAAPPQPAVPNDAVGRERAVV